MLSIGQKTLGKARKIVFFGNTILDRRLGKKVLNPRGINVAGLCRKLSCPQRVIRPGNSVGRERTREAANLANALQDH